MPSESANATTLAPPIQESPQAIEPATAEKNTYGQILKSSAIIGGSSVINIAIGIVRTKFMAVFLGPAGFGLMGLYGSIADLALSIAGMGVNSSGVRQIAEAVGSGDTGAYCPNRRRAAADIGHSRNSGCCFTGRIFRAGVHPDLRQR